jgi:hypothetical protein
LTRQADKKLTTVASNNKTETSREICQATVPATNNKMQAMQSKRTKIIPGTAVYDGIEGRQCANP